MVAGDKEGGNRGKDNTVDNNTEGAVELVPDMSAAGSSVVEMMEDRMAAVVEDKQVAKDISNCM